MMKIYYGIPNNLIDITDICIFKLMHNNIITIPAGDINRIKYFGDHISGISKNIYIDNNDKLTEYDENCIINIKMTDGSNADVCDDVNIKTFYIHSKLKIKYGHLGQEITEQRMAVRYLRGDEKVLEIGGNIGRNSLIIASILNDDKNLVTLESDPNIAKQLVENRDLNNFNFHIEKSALSQRKLMQKDWITVPSDRLEDGYQWINTITLHDLRLKYNINFDTLVLDCEGAFYYILMDMPEILDNIKLIIMENDYNEMHEKKFIDDVLLKNNFYRDYFEGGGWGPCKDNFFEVWKKNTPIC